MRLDLSSINQEAGTKLVENFRQVRVGVFYGLSAVGDTT
jgi:hypothetical protein